MGDNDLVYLNGEIKGLLEVIVGVTYVTKSSKLKWILFYYYLFTFYGYSSIFFYIYSY